MKITYNKKTLKYNLIRGILWSTLGTLNLFNNDNIKFIGPAFLFIGILYLFRFIYGLNFHYLTIENGLIYKNMPFTKKIKLSEITWIKKIYDEYILITEKTEMKLKTDFISDKSLTDLNNSLGKLNLQSDKTPFAKNV